MAGIDAGELDRRVSILRPQEVDDGTATVSGDFVEIDKRWAKKTDVSDAERFRAAQQGQALTTRFLMRWDSVTATITALDRLSCEGRVYEVVGTKEWGGRGIGVEISATSRPDIAS